MAEEGCTASAIHGAITCTRDPTPVVIEVAKPKTESISENNEIIIVEEGFPPPEKDEILVDDQAYNVYGTMSVQDGGHSIVVKPGAQTSRQPTDSSDSTCKCRATYKVVLHVQISCLVVTTHVPSGIMNRVLTKVSKKNVSSHVRLHTS